MTCAGNKKALNSGSLLARAQHARNDWNSGTVNKHATADRLFHNEKREQNSRTWPLKRKKGVRKIDQKGPRGKLALEESVLQEEQLADPQKESPHEEK